MVFCNNSCVATMASKCTYQEVYPQQIQQQLDREFERLKDVCYLDHTGSTLYASSQIQAVAQDLCENVYGNPHSLSTSSRYTTDVVDQVRYLVLKHFHTDPNEYSIIFTSGATAALKLVAESFDWTGGNINMWKVDSEVPLQTEHVSESGKVGLGEHKYDGTAGTFAYLQDNHTSVLGMRELAAKNGAHVCSISHDKAFQKLSSNTDQEEKHDANIFSGNSLFVYPAQCNFSGCKYPLAWISSVQDGVLDMSRKDNEKMSHRSKWFSLLDAATFVATNSLDLSVVKPDFVCLSFYKIFGYPTGLGALLVRNESAHVLRKVYFGGGTVLISLSSERFHVSRPILHDMFEDGTLPFLSVASLRHGFSTLHRLVGDMGLVSLHTFSLARHVHRSLVSLRHGNGAPAVTLYSDTDYADVDTQGGVVNFNLLRADGSHVGYAEVLNMANLYNIHLRTGCFCNPGACQRHLRLSVDDLRSHFQAGHVCGDHRDLIDGHPTGSVRISFGYMSSKKDADRFLDMITSCFVQGSPIFKTPDWWNSFTETYKLKFYSMKHIEKNKQLKTEKNSNLPNSKSLSSSMEKKSNFVVSKNASVTSGSSCEQSVSNDVFLSHIFVYPVKSCGAFSVTNWTIGPRGLKFDREWMIVTPVGVSLTQKLDTRMCMITPTIDLVEQVLRLDFPGLPPMFLPLNESKHGAEPDSEASLCQSKVCGDRIQGCDCGDDVATWLSDALGREGLRLVRQWDGDQRATKQGQKTQATNEKKTNLSLSNQAQFLLLNSASVDWLRERLSEDANSSADNLVQRFRCNLVVQGADTFSENEWKTVDIGRNHFRVEGPCTRCQMVCIDQSTGEKTREPLKTLAEMFHGKMRFGVYLSHMGMGDGEQTEIATGNNVSPQIKHV